MAYNLIYFENPRTAQQREAPMGTAGARFCSDLFPCLARKEGVWFLVCLAMAVLTLNLSSVVLSFFVNKLYIRYLINEGFKVRQVPYGDRLQAAEKLGIKLPSLESALIFETKVAFR